MFGFLKHQKIGLIASTAFAVGAMIGGGVFVLTGVALKQAGPSAIISFLIAGLIVSFSALSFAEVAAKASKGESAYAYVGKVLGSPIWGFVTSWCFYLGGIVGAAFVLKAFGIYMHNFIYPGLSNISWGLIGATVLTLVNLGPASRIGRIETLLVGVKLMILLILAAAGIAMFNPHDLAPFAPNGTWQIIQTSSYLFVAYLGFSVITSISGDIDKPQKTVPRAIVLSMVIVAIIYAGIVVALLAAHISDYSEASVGTAATHLLGPVGSALVIIGALVATLSSANANILGSSEIMLRLAHRKQVPTILGRLRGGHPYVSVLAGAIMYGILIIFSTDTLVVSLANTVVLTALIIVNAAAFALLFKGKHRSLRWVLSLMGLLGAAMQFLFITPPAIVLGNLGVGFGVLIYLVRELYFLPKHHREIARTVDNLDGPLGRTLKRRDPV